MTIEFVDLKEFLTVAETFARIRRDGVGKETIYTCYVIDAERHLLGAVSAKTLLLSSPEDRIGDIMERDVISASTHEDVESLANDFRKYGLLAMPVVDNEQRLVGIVTIDDVLSVQEEKATEDFEIMAAMSPSGAPYLKASIWGLAKKRLPWLIILMLTATITGTILKGFEDAISAVPVLVTFIPMLMNTSGSGGSQSATLVIRGLALEEIEIRDILRVMWKEIRVALFCGIVLAIVNFARVFVMERNAILGCIVSLALCTTIILAKMVGCALPIAAKKIKLDPAVMAGPVITTLVDACSLMVFFGIAKAVYHI